MNRISPTGRILSPWSTPRIPVSTTSRATRGGDCAEISAEARRRSTAVDAPNDTDGVRLALVARVKAQIAAGAYESDDKIDAILDKLATDLVK